MNRLETRIDRLEAGSGIGVEHVDEIVLVGIAPNGEERRRGVWRRDSGLPNFEIERGDGARQ